MILGDVRNAAEVRNVGIVVRQHGARERFDLSHADALPSERMPCDGGSFDA
jgi:hypothetical protein